jgi:hypothetical protein
VGEAIFQHGFYYPEAHDASLSDIAATLVAQERMLPVVIDVLEHLFPGLSIPDRKIVLERIERSSLKEAFFVALLVVYQKDLQEEVPAMIEAVTGANINDRFDTLITVLFMVVLYYGAERLFGRKKGVQSTAPAAITQDAARFLDLGATQLGKTPQALSAAIEKAVGTQRLPAIKKAAIDLFRPAKRGDGGRIIPLGLPEVSREAVDAFPALLTQADLEHDTVPLHIPRGHLVIRATDRDKSDKGWAGRLVSGDLKTKRLPLRLAPGLDAEALSRLDEVEVEAYLESRFTDTGSTKPLRIHVYRVLS